MHYNLYAMYRAPIKLINILNNDNIITHHSPLSISMHHVTVHCLLTIRRSVVTSTIRQHLNYM